MTDDLIARMRGWVERSGDQPMEVWPRDLRALLDHIDEKTRRAEVLDHMQEVAKANGFESLTDAITRACNAEAELARLRDCPIGITEPTICSAGTCVTCLRNHVAGLREELARLRAPVTDGEVGEMVKRLEDPRFDGPLNKSAADLLQRLAGQVSYWKRQAESAEAERRIVRDERDAETVSRAIAEARLREAVKVIKSWQSCGCPYCHGDCGSANPPVSLCIMRETDAFLSRLKDQSNGPG